MIAPRLLNVEQAADYCGLSVESFAQEVEAGTFPPAFPLAKTRRLLWDRRGLDLAMDARLTIPIELRPGGETWNERRTQWEQARAHQGRAAQAR